MTKAEFIKAMKDMPDNTEVFFWNFNTLDWKPATPYYIPSVKNEGEKRIVTHFIGIE